MIQIATFTTTLENIEIRKRKLNLLDADDLSLCPATIMEFPQMLVSSEAWVEKNDTKFRVLSSNEKEMKVHFHIPESDSDISFYLTTCDSQDGSGSKQWLVWSDNEKVLSYLNEVQDFTTTCRGKVRPLHEVLDKVDQALKKVKLEAGDDDDEDEGLDSDENFDDNYYDDDDEGDVETADDQWKDKGACADEDDGDNFFTTQGSPAAVQRLVKDLKGMQKEAGKFGIEGTPRNDNLFLWDVKLKDFPEDSKLGKDLEKFAKKFNREPVVYLEMHFPGNYPMEPPFVRILRPRFKFLTGHVTIGGSICMQMLTKSGWTPTNDIENILVQIRSEIMSDPNAQLDIQDKDEPYGEREAKDAFMRMVKRYKWE